MGQEKRGYHTRKEGLKKTNEKDFRERKYVGRQSNRRRMKEARGLKSPRVWEKSDS